jgi:hypothetical protein
MKKICHHLIPPDEICYLSFLVSIQMWPLLLLSLLVAVNGDPYGCPTNVCLISLFKNEIK